VTHTNAEEPAENGYYITSGDPYAPPEDQTVHSGPVPDLHVVRKGDTLWDICFYYFNDPWQWPKVWSYNPQITNPHWIYPGDLVRLVPRGMMTEPAPPTDVESAPPPGPVDNEPAPARKFGVELKQLAFLDQKEPDTPIVIDGSVEA